MDRLLPTVMLTSPESQIEVTYVMKRARTKAQKIYRILCPIPWVLLTIFDLVMLILGEETVMGNSVLRTLWDMEPHIFFAIIVVEAVVGFILWLWEKKHPPKENEPLLKDGHQHPPTN